MAFSNVLQNVMRRVPRVVGDIFDEDYSISGFPGTPPFLPPEMSLPPEEGFGSQEPEFDPETETVTVTKQGQTTKIPVKTKKKGGWRDMLAGAIQGGMTAMAMPSVDGGGPRDIARSFLAGQQAPMMRQQQQMDAQWGGIDRRLKYDEYQRRVKQDEERERHNREMDKSRASTAQTAEERARITEENNQLQRIRELQAAGWALTQDEGAVPADRPSLGFEIRGRKVFAYKQTPDEIATAEAEAFQPPDKLSRDQAFYDKREKKYVMPFVREPTRDNSISETELALQAAGGDPQKALDILQGRRKELKPPMAGRGGRGGSTKLTQGQIDDIARRIFNETRFNAQDPNHTFTNRRTWAAQNLPGYASSDPTIEANQNAIFNAILSLKEGDVLSRPSSQKQPSSLIGLVREGGAIPSAKPTPAQPVPQQQAAPQQPPANLVQQLKPGQRLRGPDGSIWMKNAAGQVVKVQ